MNTTVTPLQEALNMAIGDEYRAQATYRKVIDTFGPVPPFIHIGRAEGRHIAALTPLFQRYGLPLPPDKWAGKAESPANLLEACQAGINAEIANHQMYERLLAQVTEPDVRQVFSQLRSASYSCHLPAFQACAQAWQDQALNISAPPAQAVNPDAAAPPRGITSTSSAMMMGMLAGASLIWLLARNAKSAG